MSKLTNKTDDDLFTDATVFNDANDYPDTIFCGKGTTDNGRIIIQVQLSTPKFKLSDHVENGLIGLNLVEKKQVDQYGGTHFLAVQQDSSEWIPNEMGKNPDDLTAVVQKSEYVHTFTFSVKQLQRIMYKHKNFGFFAKLELVDDGILKRIFRYYKTPRQPLIEFRDSRLHTHFSTTTKTKTVEEDDDTALYADL